MRDSGNTTIAIPAHDKTWLRDRCKSGLKNIRAEKESRWERAVKSVQEERAWWSYIIPFVNKYPWAEREAAERRLKTRDGCIVSDHAMIFMRTRAEDRLEWILEMAQEDIDGGLQLSLEDYEIVKRHCL